MKLLEVLFSSCRIFPWIVKAQKGPAFLCCRALVVHVFTKQTLPSIQAFLCRWKSSYYMIKGNDNWNLCWRLLIYPLSLLLLKTQKPWPPSLVLPLHWKCNHFWLWQIFKMTLSVTCHLWGQKQLDPPKISKISPFLFFFFSKKKGSWIMNPTIRKNHKVTSVEQ